MNNTMPQTLQFGYPPVADHIYKWFPLVDDPARTGPDGEPMGPRIEVWPFSFEQQVEPMESLDARAEQGEYEVTVVSAAHYPVVADQYVVMACGARVADRYAPILVGPRAYSLNEVAGHLIAVPGLTTTPFAMLSLLLGPGKFDYEVRPTEAILPAVAAGEFSAGVLADESQVSYLDHELTTVQDLGDWWKHRHGLPLPLELVVARRDLGAKTLDRVARLLSESITHALIYREEALDFVVESLPGMTWDVVARFVDMYVNRWTRDLGEVGSEGLITLLREMNEAGIGRELTNPDVVKVG